MIMSKKTFSILKRNFSVMAILFLMTMFTCLHLTSCDNGISPNSKTNSGDIVDNTIYSIPNLESALRTEVALALVSSIYLAVDGIDYDILYNADDSDNTPFYANYYSPESGYVYMYGVSYYSYLTGSQYYGGKTKNYRYHQAGLSFHNYKYNNLELDIGNGSYNYSQKYGGFDGSTLVKVGRPVDTLADNPVPFKFTYKGKKYEGTVAVERKRTQTSGSSSVTTSHYINYLYIDGILFCENYRLS